MHSNSKKALIARVAASRLETIVRSASILAIVIDKEVGRTRISFLAFRALDT